MLSKNAAKWWTIGSGALFFCSLLLNIGCFTWLSLGGLAAFGATWYLKYQRDQRFVSQALAFPQPPHAAQVHELLTPLAVSRQSPGSKRLFVPTAREE